MRADSFAPPLENNSARVRVFHNAVAVQFARAAHKEIIHSRDFCIGDGIVRFEFAGDALITPLTRALEHLRVESARAVDLTIGLWEIESVGVPLPPPPWTRDAYQMRGELKGFTTPDHFTAFHADGRILFVYDFRNTRAYVTVFDHTQLPAYERAAPLRPLLARFLETRHIQYLHAAGVGLRDGGVLLAGKGGAGKSTTALACLDSDLFFAGDDYCAARCDGTPTVYSLHNSAKGHASTIQRLPFLEPLITNPETMAREKAIWYLREQFPEKLIHEFPLRAILIPRVTGKRDTAIRVALPQEALLALAPSTVSQVANAGAQVFHHLTALVRQVPSFHLDVGTDMPQIPQMILRVLREQAAQT